MRRWLGWMGWLLAWAVPQAHAQVVNVLPLFRDETEPGFHAEIAAGGSYLTGNVPFLTFRGNLLMRYVRGPDTVLSSTTAEFGRGSGEPFLNRQTSHLRYQRSLLDWFGVEVYTQATHDQVWRLNVRALGGTGLRFQMVDTDKTQAFTGVGYMFEFEQLSREDDVGDSGLRRYNHRLGHYATLSYKPDPIFSWTLTFYYQPRFDDPTDFRVFGTTAIGFKVKEWLAVTASLQVQYNAWVPETIERLDTTTLYQLRFSL